MCAALGDGDLLFGGMSDIKLITAVAQPIQNEIGGLKYSMEAGFAEGNALGNRVEASSATFAAAKAGGNEETCRIFFKDERESKLQKFKEILQSSRL